MMPTNADVEDLLERIATGLAGLPLQDVHGLIALGEHEIVEAADDGDALTQGCLRPPGLHLTRPSDSEHDVIESRQREFVEHLPGEGSAHRTSLITQHRAEAAGERWPREGRGDRGGHDAMLRRRRVLGAMGEIGLEFGLGAIGIPPQGCADERQCRLGGCATAVG